MEYHKQQLLKFWQGQFPFTSHEIEAFSAIDRSLFVIDEHKQDAYLDTPLPLLREKTISQPTTVMIMTHALEIEEGDKLFELGTGSGYQTAMLAALTGPKGHVFSCEVIPELVDFAKQNLKKIKMPNVTVKEDDGSKGWTEHAPFDKIMVTAACTEFPKELLDQLKVGGIIVGPVGDEEEQEMVQGTKEENGKMSYHFLGQFLFSPMVGKYGFSD